MAKTISYSEKGNLGTDQFKVSEYEMHSFFSAQKYTALPNSGLKSFATISWKVNPSKETKCYLAKLSAFYEALKTGGFEEADIMEISPEINITRYKRNGEVSYQNGIKVPEKGKKSFNLEELIAHKKGEAQEKYHSLLITTPYGEFGLNVDMSKYTLGWTPRNGSMEVTSHLDISDYVAKLISCTIPKIVLPQELKPALERVYAFEDQKPKAAEAEK
jgi:hypothetical protein